MPDHEVPGSATLHHHHHLLTVSSHPTNSGLAKSAGPATKSSQQQPPTPTNRTSGVGTLAGNQSYGQLNPVKKEKHDSEQHIPDELLHDLYPMSIDPMSRIPVNNDDHSVPNTDGLEKEPIESIENEDFPKPLDFSSKATTKHSRKQANPQQLTGIQHGNKDEPSKLPQEPRFSEMEAINNSEISPQNNGQATQIIPPYSAQQSIYDNYANPLSFASHNWQNSGRPAWNNMLAKGSHYHPYGSSPSSSKHKEQTKSPQNALDALQSCVTNLNPAKVSATNITAKATNKTDCAIKTEPRADAPSSSKTDSVAKFNQSASKDKADEPVPAHKRGGVQLWQFLRQLLDNPEKRNIIHWTRQGHDGEFKLLDPEEVARLWGCEKKRPAMNYDKLSRSIRYYYEKGIMQKVPGERYVYKFLPDTMQAVNPFTNQLALGYQDPMHWGASFGAGANPPAIPGSSQVQSGMPPQSYSDFYAQQWPQWQQLLAMQQFGPEFSQNLSGYPNIPGFPPTPWNQNPPYSG